MLSEPDVALSDYGLAVESAALAWLARRRPSDPGLAGPLTLFFASVAVAAGGGGTVHGFWSDAADGPGRVFWRVTLLALGATTWAAWAIGARLSWRPVVAHRLELGAAVVAVGYGGLVLAGVDRFGVAVAQCLPAILFLLLALVRAARRTGAGRVWMAAAGVGLMLAGAALQQLGVALHPVYVTHNTLYHLIQAGALLLLFAGSRELICA
jgi:hypothetical protein